MGHTWLLIVIHHGSHFLHAESWDPFLQKWIIGPQLLLKVLVSEEFLETNHATSNGMLAGTIFAVVLQKIVHMWIDNLLIL